MKKGTTMKKINILLLLVLITFSNARDRKPPKESLDACINKSEGSICAFVSPKGDEKGTCVYTPDNRYFGCRPNRGNNQDKQNQSNRKTNDKRDQKPKYSIEQATSDNAQLNTISFAAMSFMSSDLCEISFLPPGKHASFFGFQYLRDVVGGRAGHEQNFVPRVANNMLYILNSKQKAILLEMAKKQQDKIQEFALMRFPILMAIEKFANNDLPNGKKQLKKRAIVKQSGDLYALDGELSYERAIGFAKVINSLTQKQKRYLDKFKNKDFSSWPKRKDQLNKREYDHEVHVSLMTYSSELFSWYLGDVKKDTYFTPERTASYFGSYWTKAAPMKAVKRDNYRISTSLTSDSGTNFLQSLDNDMQSKITDLVQEQKRHLNQMVTLRKNIANQTREIYNGKKDNLEMIVNLSREFGELDGKITYMYANTFRDIKNNLSSSKLKNAIKLRNISQYQCNGVFIYAEPSNLPNVGNIDKFFK